MSDRFLICLPFTLEQECPYPQNWTDPRNFSNDKNDPGGKTFCGIIQREYDIWRKHQGLPTRDVRQLTEAEGHMIYQTNYWLTECPKLAPGLDLQFFDEAVNTGTTEATKIIQRILGIKVDGMWGTQTDAAVTVDALRTVALVKAFTARRLAVYQEMSGWQYFGKDWGRRTSEIGATALEMATQQETQVR